MAPTMAAAGRDSPSVCAMSDSDERLLERIARREADAAALLFERYADEVWSLVARRTSAAEADDLTQEVFVRVLRRASTFRAESSVRTWLWSIAYNTVRERHRQRLRATTLSGLCASGPGPESEAIGAEARRDLMAALERLPDEQAIVLELHRLDGLSHREIGRLLGIEPAASRKRLQRALSSLNAALESRADGCARHSRLETWRRSLLRRVLPEEESHGPDTGSQPT